MISPKTVLMAVAMVFASLVATVGLAPPASACDFDRPTVPEELDRGEAAVVGRATKREVAGKYWAVTIEIDRVVKGAAGEEVVAADWRTDDDTYCGITYFNTDELLDVPQFFVFSRESSGVLQLTAFGLDEDGIPPADQAVLPGLDLATTSGPRTTSGPEWLPDWIEELPTVVQLAGVVVVLLGLGLATAILTRHRQKPV